MEQVTISDDIGLDKIVILKDEKIGVIALKFIRKDGREHVIVLKKSFIPEFISRLQRVYDQMHN